MLKIHLLNTRDASHNILLEDLTGILTEPASVKEYHQDLFRLCKEKHGVGVAANQAGLKMNFFFVMPKAGFPNKNGGKPVAHICVQPKYTPIPKTLVVGGVEGCLSLPGREFVVPRHAVIQAEWLNAMGHPQSVKLKGLAARIFQHEHDHLRGIMLTQSGKEVM